MRIKRRRAVRADDPDVLDPVVVSRSVHVVENQAHSATTPDLPLATDFADRPLQPRLIEAGLEIAARVSRSLHEDLVQRNRLIRSSERLPVGRPGIEVVRGDLPSVRPGFQRLRVATGGAVPQSPQGLRP